MRPAGTEVMTAACYYGCGAMTELRPYGPDGSLVCFECATATPEREAEADRNFDAAVEAAVAASPVGTVTHDRDGIHPTIPENRGESDA